MKRKWNWPLWVGFVVAFGCLFTYEFFAQFPITRDFPWANLLLFGIGATLLVIGFFLKMGFGFPLLSDADAGVIRRYDVLHRVRGPKRC